MPLSIRVRVRHVFTLLVAIVAAQAHIAFALPLAYAVDDDYASGSFTGDAFASNLELPNNTFVGKKVLRVGDDVLVAALVKHPGGGQSNGMWNLGLVRYNGSGSQRRIWAAPTPSYAHELDQYIVYPNSPTALIRGVQDMRVLGNRIYVLVDEQYTTTVDISVARIYVFDLDGRFITGAIPFSANGAAVGDTPILAGGLATYTDLAAGKRYLAVAGTRFFAGTSHGRPVYTRYEIVDTGGLGAAMPMVVMNTSACWNPAWECHVRALEANALYSPKLYVAMAYRPNSTTQDWNVVVSRIDVNGVGDGSWDPNNVSHGVSDGGNNSDIPVGMDVRTPPSQGAFRDEIYVVSESARNCQTGIGVMRFDHDGNRVAARLIGGDTSIGQDCNANTRRFDRPQAIVANATNTHAVDALLAIVGYAGRSFVAGPPTTASLTVLDTNLQTQGTLDVLYPVDTTATVGTHFPALYGVVSDGTGTFTAVGSLTHRVDSVAPAPLRGKSMVATVRFAPDVGVFEDGFE